VILELNVPLGEDFRIRALKNPSPFPMERPVGPSRPPPNYEGVAAGKAEEVDVDSAYAQLTRLVDLELAEVCQIPQEELAKHLGRESPEEKWVTPLDKGDKAVPRGSVVARNLMWAGDRAREVLGLRRSFKPGAISRRNSLEANLRSSGRSFGEDPEVVGIAQKLKQSKALSDSELERWADAAVNCGTKLAAEHGRVRAKGFREWAKTAPPGSCRLAHRGARPPPPAPPRENQ